MSAVGGKIKSICERTRVIFSERAEEFWPEIVVDSPPDIVEELGDGAAVIAEDAIMKPIVEFR